MGALVLLLRDQTVSVDGGDFSNESIDITFVEPAMIINIRPSKVQEGSDEILIISGDNFISSQDLQCCFGEPGLLWTPGVWVSESKPSFELDCRRTYSRWHHKQRHKRGCILD